MQFRRVVTRDWFNPAAIYPFNLRPLDFEGAMQDVYDFFHDVNLHLDDHQLARLDDMLRPAICSGVISDMLTEALAKHSRSLTVNLYHNGHPDLLVKGYYPSDSIKSGTEGVEIKSTRRSGGAVDTHGARKQWMCVFVYKVDNNTEPAKNRQPLKFTEIYLEQVEPDDFRKNNRSELGTRTATLDAEGLRKLRANWIYREPTKKIKEN